MPFLPPNQQRQSTEGTLVTVQKTPTHQTVPVLKSRTHTLIKHSKLLMISYNNVIVNLKYWISDQYKLQANTSHTDQHI